MTPSEQKKLAEQIAEVLLTGVNGEQWINERYMGCFRCCLMRQIRDVLASTQPVPQPPALGPHDWTHTADVCDEPGCEHITRRTCEGAEKLTKWLRETLKKRTDLLCKADPAWAERAAQNLFRSIFDREPPEEPVPQPLGATCEVRIEERREFGSPLTFGYVFRPCGNLLPCSTHPTKERTCDFWYAAAGSRCSRPLPCPDHPPVPPSGDVVLVNESAEMEAEWLTQRDRFRYYSARAGFEAGWLARAAKERRTP